MTVQQVDFVWRPKASNETFVSLECPIEIPNQTDLGELAFRLIKLHNLPFYVKNELHNDLIQFIKEKTDEFFNKTSEAALKAFRDACRDNPNHEEQVVASIADKYAKEYKEFSTADTVTDRRDDAEFSQLYHTLMHSGDQLEVMRIEDGFSAKALLLRSEKDKDFEALIQKQNRELESSQDFNELLLNKLAMVHVEERQAFDVRWEQTQSGLQQKQRIIMKDWMDKAVLGEFLPPESEACFIATDQNLDAGDVRHPKTESFTIHLGSQLKVMHNLRLTCLDPLDFCRKLSPVETSQTSMCLYSANLHGVVILVDNRVSSYKGMKRKFAEQCKLRCELHFPDIDAQLANIRKLVKDSKQRDGKEEANHATNDEVLLEVGDVYITRHSNLSGAHVVFHLVAGSYEDELFEKDLSARHQVIQGLRNILRVAYERDIRTLSIPLLLANESHDKMTHSWCSRRAELLYKCVKGFMIEMASIVAEVGNSPRTIEFLLPSDIDDSIYASLSSMLQNIFKMSNPLVLKASGSLRRNGTLH